MEVMLFGIAREIVGKKILTLKPEEKVNTVGELKSWLRSQYPRFQQLSSMAVAVDSEYANDEDALVSESEVALIPPVSGG
jgi:molybdopterin synthase sulfur carrier subunit